MYQTSYAGITTLSYGLPFNGGFCAWWYTAKENILAWPAVNPLNQYLLTEPTLKAGATWLGPVKVPDNSLGFEEPLKTNAAGLYYQQKVSGFHPGDDIFNRVNISNLPFHEFIIIGKMRAGGFFLVLGSDERGLKFTPDFSSGNGMKGVAGTNFSFNRQSLDKGQVLLSFSQSPNTPPPGWEGPGTGNTDDGSNQTEIITFGTETEITLDWNSTRIDKFGVFPEIQVWQNGPPVQMINVSIAVDAAPPDNTLFTIYTPGVPGFVVLK